MLALHALRDYSVGCSVKVKNELHESLLGALV